MRKPSAICPCSESISRLSDSSFTMMIVLEKVSATATKRLSTQPMPSPSPIRNPNAVVNSTCPSPVVTATATAREREAGTFDQLLVTPLRPVEILIGKSIPGILIGLIEGTFILLVVIYWFEVPLRGSLGALYLGMFLFLLSAVGIGLMISSLAVTQQQGILGAFLFLVPAVILSGFATPISNMPELVQQLTLINPMRYFMVILRGVFLEGDSYALLFNQYWPMTIIAIVTLSLAGWLFRNRMN